MASTTTSSRRERIRAQTLAEIREHAYAQIAVGGPTAMSLNGIAKAMGMSGPAMYRYFASRDELLATLVAESYEDVADTLAAAAAGARHRAPESRLRVVTDTFRAWALRSPHRYRLVFGSTYGSGALDRDRIVPPAHRAMTVVLSALADIDPGDGTPLAAGQPLTHQLEAWGNRWPSETRFSSRVLLLAMFAWTRMHGIISLEIEGVFDQMGIDPARLYKVEIDHLIAQRSMAGTTR